MSFGETGSRDPAIPPKILLTGRNGQVGGDLYPLLTKMGEVLATDRSSLDLTRPENVRECVRTFRPDVIINAAAYTAVDKAESEPDLAHGINTVAPGVFAEEAAKCGARFIHYSTDYVFDGRKTEPYIESDPVNPLNVYGRTKAAGEEAITHTDCAHLILRTSWVYSRRGSNFLLTILRLAREREELRIVNDQIGAPTSSQSIAEITVQILQHCLRQAPSKLTTKGIYHLTAAGHCSWYEFTCEILRRASSQDFRVKKVSPIPSTEYVKPARRPLNSRLDCSKIVKAFGVNLIDWHTSLGSVVEEYSASCAGSQSR